MTTDLSPFEFHHSGKQYRAVPKPGIDWPTGAAERVQRTYWLVYEGDELVQRIPVEQFPTADKARQEAIYWLDRPNLPIVGGPMNGQTATPNMGRILEDAPVSEEGRYRRRGSHYEWEPFRKPKGR